jgi:hypothetical protein
VAGDAEDRTARVAVAVTAQEKFRALVRDDFDPWLKQQGFSRKDATFRRRVDGSWQIVNFQRNRYSNARRLTFTVNLGVALAVVHRDDSDWAARGWPLEHECDLRDRLGMLVSGKDRWWSVRALLPVRSVAKRVIGDLERVGLPWLSLHSDGHRLLAHAVADPSAVSPMNLGSLVSLAEAIGTPEQQTVIRRAARRRGAA